jgi:hypothetical protein
VSGLRGRLARAPIPHREHLGYRFNPIDIFRLPFMYCILSFHNGIRGSSSVIAFLVCGVVHTTSPTRRSRNTYICIRSSFIRRLYGATSFSSLFFPPLSALLYFPFLHPLLGLFFSPLRYICAESRCGRLIRNCETLSHWTYAPSSVKPSHADKRRETTRRNHIHARQHIAREVDMDLVTKTTRKGK